MAAVNSRSSKWTNIYCDFDKQGTLFFYIRFVPTFMDTEFAGFSHGITIGGTHFADEAEANKVADAYDAFFEVMVRDLLDPDNNPDVLDTPITSDNETVVTLKQSAIVAQNWLGGNCDMQNIPRVEIALLARFCDLVANSGLEVPVLVEAET